MSVAEGSAAEGWVYALCGCGHKALDHHGTDPTDGCLGVASHKLPQCPCAYTCSEVRIHQGVENMREHTHSQGPRRE